MRSGHRLYDAHTHIDTARHSGRRYSADDLLRDMDRFGVDRSMVIPFPVVEDCRAAHDEIGRAVLAHPDRLSGSACQYPYIAETEFRAEIRRCREQYGFRAMKLQPQFQALNPISRSSDFWFETATENRMAAICHTGSGAPYALPSSFMMAARRFPDLPIVLAHAGGGGMFAGEAITAAVFCPNIYLELSSLMPHHILEVLGHVPAHRLMIGSDLPESLATEFGKILELTIGEEERGAILFGTAARIFDANSA
jgi:predicted TIM-barrel fold metal-dependent hydrolase